MNEAHRKYEKIVLNKGFVIVLERFHLPQICWPQVYFYGAKGQYAFSIPAEQLSGFRDLLLLLGQTCKKEQGRIPWYEKSSDYFSWINGRLYLIPEKSSPLATHDAIVIIDSESGSKFLKAIDYFA